MGVFEIIEIDTDFCHKRSSSKFMDTADNLGRINSEINIEEENIERKCMIRMIHTLLKQQWK